MTDHGSDTGEAGELGTTGKTGPSLRLGGQRQWQAVYPFSTVQYCTVKPGED
jgi:hypothetical protein